MTRAHDTNGVAPSQTRVVLLGGKALAIRCAEHLLDMPEVELAALIPCADDDPREARWYPSLARWARERHLPVCQPASVNDRDFQPVLREFQPDVLLSTFYDKILKRRVLEQARLAAVNIHFGLLPYNRGSFPIPWAMIDGNDPGVTMHEMDPGVDTGDIIAQAAVPAAEHETALDIYERCTAAGEHIFRRYFPLLLQGRAPRRSQPAGGTYYRPGYPFDRWIDWSRDAAAVARVVRALTFPPFPSARTVCAGRELEVRHPVWPEPDTPGHRPGTVIEVERHSTTIATGHGVIAVQTMALGGEALPAYEALRRLGAGEGTMLESRTWQNAHAA